MNFIHRSIWKARAGTFVAVSESTRNAGKKIPACIARVQTCLRLKLLAVSLMTAYGANVVAQPMGGVVTAGAATIGGTSGKMTITQTTSNVAINWQSFGIKAGESVQFVQPSSSSVALNRVTGPDPSSILGSLTSNGKVFLVNSNGILFGQGATVNVGGLVASTLAISDADFMARNYQFSGAGREAVINRGSINAASGGYVVLLGANVSNQGSIAAQLGTVALAAGNAITLDVAGNKLVNVTVTQGALNALAANGGLIRADGGQVLITTQAAGSLLFNAVNNTGVIQAQTLQNINGIIKLLAGMDGGTLNVGGTLDASAPSGGNGGFIETSAARVMVAANAKVTTLAARGLTGNWLIDPQDFTVGGGSTDNISGSTLSALLVTNSVTISTATGTDVSGAGTPPLTTLHTTTPGNGDIHINQSINWTASSSPTTLRLRPDRDININAGVSATNGNFVACCGRDVNVNSPITTTNGSVLVNAGRNVNLRAALTTTDGNINICSAQDINISEKITLTRGSLIAGQSLGLPLGLVLNAGYGGTGPGIAGGTLNFALGVPPGTVTGPDAPITINYNPPSYATPTDYSSNFILSGGATLTQRMLVFADGANKTFDGTTNASLSSLKGNPAGVTLVAGPGNSATFDTADVGIGKTVSFTGYTLGGTNASAYALPVSCCSPALARTTANITPAPQAFVPPKLVAAPPPVAVRAPVAAPPTAVVPLPVVAALLPVVIPPLFVLTSVAEPAVVILPVVGLPLLMSRTLDLKIVSPILLDPSVLTEASPEEDPAVLLAQAPNETASLVEPQRYVARYRVRKQDRH